jgi:hypothetical protein
MRSKGLKSREEEQSEGDDGQRPEHRLSNWI